jgi:hypothetical protein
MPLSKRQTAVLMRADKSGMIYEGDSEICPGIHFCSDWDSLPVCDDSPEADACGCGRLTEKDKE